jgi:hypothetical protein
MGRRPEAQLLAITIGQRDITPCRRWHAGVAQQRAVAPDWRPASRHAPLVPGTRGPARADRVDAAAIAGEPEVDVADDAQPGC